MNASAASALDRLRLALHGVTAPFFCAGTFTPDKPVTLVFADQSRCVVRRSENRLDDGAEVKNLIDHCKPASFGAGRKTRYNREVREAVQLRAEKGAFSVENFEPASSGILTEVQRELLPQIGEPVTAELYAVNVYTTNGHFAPHKDTPRGDDMFGTLLVCLPSSFSDGAFILKHRGIVERFDWASDIREQKDPNQVHWVAFFGDVDHQVERVWYGNRVTLSYLLRRAAATAPAPPPPDETPTRLDEAWSALLADPTFMPEGGTLGYPCGHLYHQDARFQQEQKTLTAESATMLKGRDYRAAESALRAGLKVKMVPYMAENCADETWQLERFPTPEEQRRLRRQMDSARLEKALPIVASSEEEGDFGVTWIEDPPESGLPRDPIPEDESLPPSAAHLHSCEYCPWGYFGNEASEIDLYTYAALHITVPALGKRPRVAKKAEKAVAAKRPSAKRAAPAKRKPSKK